MSAPSLPRPLELLALLAALIAGSLLLLDGGGGSESAFSVLLLAGGLLVASLGVRAVAACLDRGGAVAAVAAVGIRELVRRRVLGLTLLLLFGGIALLRGLGGGGALLEARLEGFLAYALAWVFLVLSLFTLLASTGSLCEEIESRRLHTVVVKPIGRFRLLAGKWLGVALVDAVLLVAAAGAIDLSVERALRGADEGGRSWRATHRSVRPEFPELFLAESRSRAEERRANDPGLWRALLIERGGDEEAALLDLQRQAYRELLARWATIPVGERRRYEFSIPEREAGPVVLVLAPHLGRAHAADRQRFDVRSGSEVRPVFLGGGESTRLELPTRAVEEGRLVVEIENAVQGRPGYGATFTGEDRLSIEVPTGSFRANLARACAVLAVQLSFVAALGVVSATFLGLPVAMLLVLLVLLAASLGGGLLDLEPERARSPLDRAIAARNAPEEDHAHTHDHDHDHGHDHDHASHGAATGAAAHDHDHSVKASPVMDILDRSGRRLVSLLGAWGRAEPIDSVAKRREIPGAAVRGALLEIGALWTGLVGLLGLIVFRRRELARVQV